MSQQINLINPTLIKQKDLLTRPRIIMAYGLLLLFVLAFAAYTWHQVTDLLATKSQLAVALEKRQAELAQLTTARAPRAPNQALVAQLALLESKQNVQTQLLEMMNRGQVSQEKSLASYMRGLAKQTMDGLWLTGFSIDQANHSVTLRGRTLNADALPDYMHQLGQEPVFSGQLFGGLRIQEQSEKAVNKLADSQSSADVAKNEQPYVEFELKGIEKLDAQHTGLGAAQGEKKS
jgi:cell division protein FtsB